MCYSDTPRAVSEDVVNSSCNKLGDQRHVGGTGHWQAMSRLVFFNELPLGLTEYSIRFNVHAAIRQSKLEKAYIQPALQRRLQSQ